MDYNIFLIGFMGAGKSTVAAQLVKLLGAERLEMDAEIEREEGTAISKIFETKGESYFRSLETELLRRLGDETGKIVSCGGGAPMREENVVLMKKSGPVVLLTALPETVYERVKDSDERPILNGNMNVEYIRGLMEKRREKYEAAADLSVATDGKSAEEIAREIIARVERTRMADAHR